MKEIKTSKYMEKESDLVTHPPVDGEETFPSSYKGKKKKKIYQLNRVVDSPDGEE